MHSARNNSIRKENDSSRSTGLRCEGVREGKHFRNEILLDLVFCSNVLREKQTRTLKLSIGLNSDLVNAIQFRLFTKSTNTHNCYPSNNQTNRSHKIPFTDEKIC